MGVNLMGLHAKDKGDGKDIDPVKQGMHQAICYGVYDLGTQFNEVFGNTSHQSYLQFELPSERLEIEKDGEKLNLPRTISLMTRLSLHEKSNLRKHLETWRGKAFTREELQGFNLEKLLGVNCILQILHKTKNDKTYANISAIMPLTKLEKKMTPENQLAFFSFEDGGDIPENTPEWIVKIIHKSEEWKQINNPGLEEPLQEPEGFGDESMGDDLDDLPF